MESPVSEPRSYRIFATILKLLLPFLVAAPLAAQAPRPQLILALGDSLTAGYQLKPGESFPAQLEAALRKDGRNVRVHNAGVSGDTTAQGKARLPWVLNSLKAKPDLAIVALGANDMLRGQPVPAARANLDAILIELDRRGIPVLLAGMLAAPNLGAPYARDFNAIYPALAKKHDVPLYPFFLTGVTPNPKLLLADRMHPNPQGVAVMVRNIRPAVERALPPPAPAPARKAP
jgi:acyl-CoA thioesterase-1